MKNLSRQRFEIAQGNAIRRVMLELGRTCFFSREQNSRKINEGNLDLQHLSNIHVRYRNEGTAFSLLSFFRLIARNVKYGSLFWRMLHPSSSLPNGTKSPNQKVAEESFSLQKTLGFCTNNVLRMFSMVKMKNMHSKKHINHTSTLTNGQEVQKRPERETSSKIF